MINNEEFEKRIGSLVCIEWFDACSCELDEDTILRMSGDGSNLLVENKTYGQLFAIFDEVVVIKTEESSLQDSSFTIIPKGWVIDIYEDR